MAAPAHPRLTLNRILIVKLADHGDAILATSAIAALHASYPSATIDVLTTAHGAAVFHMCPDIERVIDIDKHAFDNPAGLVNPLKALALARFVLRLRRTRYDAVVLLHHLTTRFGAAKFDWLCRGIAAPIRAGLDNGYGQFLTHRAVDYGFGVQSVHDYGLAVIAQLGANTSDPHPALVVPHAARDSAGALLAQHGVESNFVVIHPSVGGFSTARNWSPERFAQVARLIKETTGNKIVLVGAHDSAEAAGIIAQSCDVADLIGQTSFAELAAVLKRARLVIGADSGVVHLAAALDTPVLAIFGPSNHLAWKPFGATILTQPITEVPNGTTFVIRSDLPCSPCLYTGFSLGRREGCALRTCLDRVLVNDVAKIAIRILTKTGLKKSTTTF